MLVEIARLFRADAAGEIDLVDRRAVDQALARRTLDPALPTPMLVVFSSSLECSLPPSMVIGTQDHSGNSMHFLVALEQSPSEGS
jgi:hypothetical protein